MGLASISRAGSRLPHCSALISAHAAALQPQGSTALEQLWNMERGGDDVPGEGQADLTPLPAAKCSVGSAVITQNRGTVCASSKRQSWLEIHQGTAWGSDFLQEPPREMPAPCPTVPGSFPSPPPLKVPADACYSLEARNTGLDLARNVDRRKERSCINLKNPPHVAVTYCSRYKGPFLAEERGSKAVPVTALSLWEQTQCPGASCTSQAETHLPHGEQLIPGNHLLLPWFCCQLPPKTWAVSAPTCPTQAPVST